MRIKLVANLQEQVAGQLRRRILSGQLAAGTPVREQELANEFGISRGPIRDALLTLTKEGLLVARPNVGVRVAAEPSPFKRNVIVRLRREVEGAALMGWFERKDPSLLEAIEKNLGQYKEACGGTDLGQVVELDMAGMVQAVLLQEEAVAEIMDLLTELQILEVEVLQILVMVDQE